MLDKFIRDKDLLKLEKRQAYYSYLFDLFAEQVEDVQDQESSDEEERKQPDNNHADRFIKIFDELMKH